MPQGSSQEAKMIQLVTHDSYGEFVDDLAEMHRLRYRVFTERLGWDVQVSGGMEIDEFDALHPAYLLQWGSDDRLQGCVRLLPSAGPNMLRDTFPALLGERSAPASPEIWESSRFALDAVPNSTKAAGGLTRATYELFAGMIEFGLSRRLTDIVTVTDVRMERILRRAGWPLVRIGEPTMLDATLAVAGYLKVSVDGLARVRGNGDLRRPVLWAPVVRAAA
jgi:N-acyl-L-homoserine lactone synthetase